MSTVDVQRRRTAPKAVETSDVTRFRGVMIAAIVAAVVAATVALATSSGLRGPGPLARPHVAAGVQCNQCHATERASASCANCHGAHPSTRAAHAELMATGELECASCHQIHRTNAGVAFVPGEGPLRYGPGAEEAVAVETGFFAPKTTTVALVPASACGRCHDTSSPRDPIAACLVAGQESLGGKRPTVCFDEHRTVATVGTQDTERDAAWEAARVVAAAAPLAPGQTMFAGSLGWIGAGLGAGLLAFGAVRIGARRRRQTADTSPQMLKPSEVKKLPVIDTSTCIGCYACVDACPYDVLEVKRYVAVVAKPDDCCGLTLCEQRCPNGSLVVTAGERVEDRPPVSDSLESEDVPGLYIAGDLSGLPLIRNAINQGAHAVQKLSEALVERDDGLDVVIVGAGPAGISAALEAKRRKLRYEVLEQGSVAQSIRSFPRGKLVFDQPLGMPVVGDLWLEESSKEELLGKWLRIVRREALEIREGHRVASIDGNRETGFEVHAIAPDGSELRLRPRRVVLATGRRGSPRMLSVGVPESVEDHVHYSLADARTFEGQRVLVVGLGDVAMETAVALSRQPGTEVTVSYRREDFHRGKSRNVDEMRRAIDAGRIDVRWGTEVREVSPGSGAVRVLLGGAAGRHAVEVDAVFVMIGSIPPRDFLARVGIRVGEPELP